MCLLFDGLFFKHYNLIRVISMFILLSDLNYQNLATGLTNDTTTLFVCSKSVVWLQCMNLINIKVLILDDWIQYVSKQQNTEGIIWHQQGRCCFVAI